MQKIAVLGAGRVGYAIIHDLASNYSISAFDLDDLALKEIQNLNHVKPFKRDLQTADFKDLLKGHDLVISAVPGFMGYEILKKVIRCGLDVVDISFFPEDPFDLDTMAKSNQVCAVVDCGVAPGMGNIILGRYNESMSINSYECLVGGLPVERKWPYQYKAGFSPIDVIEEYIRPSRFVKNRQIVTREALSDPEYVQFEGIGTLESFNTDGLRTLINTMRIPDMIEKTLRYPGTIEYLKVLRESGFFSYDPVDINGNSIRPIDLSSKLLFPIWKFEKGEADVTVMRITISGEINGIAQKIVYHLFDEYDHINQISSMARTTGYTCTAVANLILNGTYRESGINPPEFLGRNQSNYNSILNYLKQRKIIYRKELIED
jgi:saccharopine dehydrogenase-like NADP-dependent oxidoreductase